MEEGIFDEHTVLALDGGPRCCRGELLRSRQRRPYGLRVFQWQESRAEDNRVWRQGRLESGEPGLCNTDGRWEKWSPAAAG